MPAYVCDFSRSPHATLRPVPVNAVTLTDNFWAPRLKTNREVTLPAQLKHCEETGRIDNFRRASGKMRGEFQGLYPFDDSDVYKWAEAAAWSLASFPDPKLEAELEAVIAEIAAAQQPDGYLNTYFMGERAAQRYTNLKDLHEIYCAGHLIQAAVAHHRATGRRTFLDVAVRLADHLDATFGPEFQGKRPGACGHPEAEMALVELYRETGERRYLSLAKHMIDVRGQKPPLLGGKPYHQDHEPFTEMNEVTGHAVRMLYLCCGAADVALETNVPGYASALEKLWKNFTTRRMYVTGAAGARHEGEAFGEDYELPNERAYAETCAAIASVMWNWRMLHLEGPGPVEYADLIERTLYNAVLPGLSLDGTRYFYENPLADAGKHRRQEWFGCACCPPNIARTLASVPGYFYSTDDNNGVYVHLYASNTAAIPLPNGDTLRLTQTTNYPWSGEIEIRVDEAPETPFSLHLRIPRWYDPFRDPHYEREAVNAALTVNGGPVDFGKATVDGEERERRFVSEVYENLGRYVRVGRLWRAGDVVRLNLEMRVEWLYSHPRVASNYGRTALRRGPLIYCMEQSDHEGQEVGPIPYGPERGERQRLDVREVRLHRFMEWEAVRQPELLGGITILRGRALAEEKDSEWHDTPHDAYLAGNHYRRDLYPADVTAIPYYAWANREAGPMVVWIPEV